MYKSNFYCIIGDVHSRAKALSQVLADYPTHQVIFLGDILDGRHKTSCEAEKTLEDLATINLVLTALKNGSKLLVGNHDLNLILNEESKSSLTRSTKARLKEYALFTNFLKQVALSDTFLTINSGSKTYELSHANPFASSTRLQQIYGEKLNGERAKWYKNTQTWPNNVVKVCGHYHCIIVEPNLIVLDGDNKQNNCLPVLIIENGAHSLKTYTNE